VDNFGDSEAQAVSEHGVSRISPPSCDRYPGGGCRIRDEDRFTGGITIVKDYVVLCPQRSQEMFVPLVHPHAQADFGEAIGTSCSMTNAEAGAAIGMLLSPTDASALRRLLRRRRCHRHGFGCRGGGWSGR